MANIRNQNIIRKAVNELKIDQAVEPVPAISQNFVQPTYELNKPNSNIVRHLNVSSSGSNTIYTTPDDERDFFLTAVILNYEADATCDNTNIRMEVVIDGATQRIVTLQKLNTTASSKSVNVSFHSPIKLDKGTNINEATAFTVGSCAISATIVGYLM